MTPSEQVAVEKICLLAQTLTSLAREQSNQPLLGAELSDYRIAVNALGAEAKSDECLYRALGFPQGMSLETLSVSELHKQQIQLGRRVPGELVSVGIYPCNINGVFYNDQDAIKHGQHIQILSVNAANHTTVDGEGLPALLPQSLWEASLLSIDFEPDPSNANWADAPSTRQYLASLLDRYHAVIKLL